MLDKILTGFQFFAAKIRPFYQKFIIFEILPLAADFLKISIFMKNSKQGVQTMPLDELNNIVTWANISCIFQNWTKL
jgi:hypothetical protein